ncbi:serine protease 55 isoform X2 [Eretmochelys imbricata]
MAIPTLRCAACSELPLRRRVPPTFAEGLCSPCSRFDSILLLSPPDLYIAFGGADLESHQVEKKKLDRLILHEHFDSANMDNDVALILLDSPIEFSEQKLPICLPFIRDLQTWKGCWVAGWGAPVAGDKTTLTKRLKKMEMKLISKKQCSEWVPELTENTLCAGSAEGGKDACQVKETTGDLWFAPMETS